MNYFPFLMLVLTVNLIPGASVVFVSSETISNGFIAGILAAISLALGDFILVGAIGLGFASVLQHHPGIIKLIKYSGAAYLCYLGLSQLIKKSRALEGSVQSVGRTYTPKVFGYGILYEVLNPKLIIFFIALLPVFINFTSKHVFLQFIILGSIFSLSSVMVNASYAWLFHELNTRFFANGNFKKYAQKISGIVMLIIAGIIIAFD